MDFGPIPEIGGVLRLAARLFWAKPQTCLLFLGFLFGNWLFVSIFLSFFVIFRFIFVIFRFISIARVLKIRMGPKTPYFSVNFIDFGPIPEIHDDLRLAARLF